MADGPGVLKDKNELYVFKGILEKNMKNGPCEFIINNQANNSKTGIYKGDFVYNLEKSN